MTNTIYLEEKIRESGIKKSKIIAALGLSYQGFDNKVKGRTAFKAYEIADLSKLLNLSKNDKELIFFANDVDKKST